MSSINSLPNTLSIGLGANIISPAGSPTSTLITVRPIIEKTIIQWLNDFIDEKGLKDSVWEKTSFHWSSLYKTKPVGGPKDQPYFINAVVIVSGENFTKLSPSLKAANDLLDRLGAIERQFGRDRITTWGPRSLDIDILAWSDLHSQDKNLKLPHPRSIERNFVIIPLAEALKSNSDEMPIKLNPQEGWEE